MRLSLRFILPLVAVLAALAWAALPLIDRLTLRWFTRDVNLRAALVANTIDESMTTLKATNDVVGMRRLLTRITQDERIFASGVCVSDHAKLVATANMPSGIACDSLDAHGTAATVLQEKNGPLLLSVLPIATLADSTGRVIIVHDMSFIARRSGETKRYVFYSFLALGTIVSLLTVVIAQLSWRGWVEGIRSMVRGEGLMQLATKGSEGELQPIADDLRALIRDLDAEHRMRDEEELAWSPETLRGILHRELRGHDVLVTSNREPYIHVREGGGIAIQRPASGLVTAVEPVMRACSGTWIAHGSGAADRETVDRNDRIAVPVENPAYQLRRLWMTEAEEQGYYYGFANEGLWPLCHIAHVRPTFRTHDWEYYQTVNKRFANAVISEARSDDPIVLVHDYHLALVPRLVRQQLPDATIITFWHIPWPNPEAFAICPWREELLDGLLGSSILGFHTQFHCNNFLDTVDRQLEARVDRETFNVSYTAQTTAVKRYPISVDWPPSNELVAEPVETCRARVRSRHHLPEDHLVGVGVDRLDYTKGLEERMRAIERLFELHPELIGRFTFIQIAAPTRSTIEDYRQYRERVRRMADTINARFRAAPPHPAILLLIEHHDTQQVYEYYRAAELCFVSSLHDGMNLVAKEFVAARDDDNGVLILSQFTGAARELPEALIVNPYDADQCAGALNVALTMSRTAQRARMRLMRNLVREFNVYRWAGRMLLDAATMRRRFRLLNRMADPLAGAPRSSSRSVSAG